MEVGKPQGVKFEQVKYFFSAALDTWSVSKVFEVSDPITSQRLDLIFQK